MSVGGAYAVEATGAGSAPRAVLMASPQLEDGFTQVADELMEAFARAPLNGSQWRIVWAIIRLTYGFHCKSTTISLRDLVARTGLNRSTVADELRALVRRGYLLAHGDDSHAKEYGIQKDYERWDGDADAATIAPEGVRQSAHPLPERVRRSASGTPVGAPAKGTPVDTPPARKGTPIGVRGVRRSAYPNKEGVKETTEKGSEPHGSGVAVAPPSGTLREQFESGYKAAETQEQRIAVAADYFGRMLGPPDYGRVGKLLQVAKSGGALFNAMAEAARQTITDDPHDYVEAIVRRESGKERGDGHDGHRAGGGAGAGAAGPRRGGAAARPGATGGHRTYRDDDLWTQDFRPKE